MCTRFTNRLSTDGTDSRSGFDLGSKVSDTTIFKERTQLSFGNLVGILQYALNRNYTDG